ncbi:MAG TPA: aldo/keto reductase [Bacillota bacterium]
METNPLGYTGIMVSRLCFGTLALSPIQKECPSEQAAELFLRAYDLGVNFFDTAELYQNYEPLAIALQSRPQMVISSRSYAVTFAEMRRSIDLARTALNRDWIDIFGIHEIESEATLRGHRGALDYLCQAKAQGIIRAVAISTHTVAGVRAGATEPAVDVIHPLINREGIGIRDGSVAEMIAALQTAKEFGKGIYAMKVLAGGHLNGDAPAAIRFITGLDLADSMAIGMQSLAEVRLNLELISGTTPDKALLAEVGRTKRFLRIADWCHGCGRCVSRCGFGALSLVNGRVAVDQARCMHCGYCARVCPDFCLKIM